MGSSAPHRDREWATARIPRCHTQRHCTAVNCRRPAATCERKLLNLAYVSLSSGAVSASAVDSLQVFAPETSRTCGCEDSLSTRGDIYYAITYTRKYSCCIHAHSLDVLSEDEIILSPFATERGNSENTQAHYSQRHRTAVSIVVLQRHVSEVCKYCCSRFTQHVRILPQRSTIYKYQRPRPLGRLAVKIPSQRSARHSFMVLWSRDRPDVIL